MESKNQILHDFVDWYNEHHPENYIPNSRLGNYLHECEGKSDSTSEKDLRVCDVIASALFDCDTCIHFPCQKNQAFYGSIEKKMPFGNCGDHSEHGYQ